MFLEGDLNQIINLKFEDKYLAKEMYMYTNLYACTFLPQALKEKKIQIDWQLYRQTGVCQQSNR